MFFVWKVRRGRGMTVLSRDKTEVLRGVRGVNECSTDTSNKMNLKISLICT